MTLFPTAVSVLICSLFLKCKPQNIFAVKNELIDPTPQRINTVVVSAIGTAMLLYFIVSCFGYSTHGDNVESDILTNYPGKCETAILSHKI